MTTRPFKLLVSIAALGLALAGCSDGDDPGAEVDCGPGTELNDDGTACQPGGDGGLDCGPGTEANADATACVPDSEACGPDTTLVDGRCQADAALECGANTVDDQGRCVPTDGTCAPGTRFDEASGTCQPDASTCGPDTTFDPDTSTCAPGDGLCPADQTWDAATSACVAATDIACGAGTIDDGGGTCVPDSDTICGTGASLDDTTGQCVADVACGAGTVASEGECVSPTEAIARDLTTTRETVPDANDPATGGAAETLAMPTLGNSTFFAGTIDTPADLDGDGELDQDLDAWSFTASAGDYVRIHVSPNGQLPVGFMVTGPDGYMRWSPLLVERGAERTLLLPHDGEYHLIVAPQTTLAADSVSDVGLVGSPSDGYVGALELRDLPAAAPLTRDTVQAVDLLALDQNLFQLVGAPDELVGVDLQATAPYLPVQAAVIVLDAQGQPLADVADASARFYSVFEATDGLQLFVEYRWLHGTQDDHELSFGVPAQLIDVGDLAADGTFTQVSEPVGDEPIVVRFAADAGQVVQAEVYAVGSTLWPEMRLFDASGPLGSAEENDWRNHAALYSEVANEYVLEVRNPWSGSPTRFSIALGSYTPQALGTLDLTTETSLTSTSVSLADREYTYFIVEAAELMYASALLQRTDGYNVDMRVFDTRSVALETRFDASSTDDLTAERILLDGGTSMIVEAAVTAEFGASVQLTATASAPPVVEVEPNDTPAQALTITVDDVVRGYNGGGGADPDHVTLTVAPGQSGIYRFRVEGRADGEPRVRVTNDLGEVLDDYSSYRTVDSLVFLDEGTYDIEVTSTQWSPAFDYELITTVSTPSDVALDGSPNDTGATATVVTDNEIPFTIVGGLTGSTDTDWYRFQVSQHGPLRLELAPFSGTAGLGALSLNVYSDAAGTMPIGSGTELEALPGVDYYLEVSGFTEGAGNTYQITANAPPDLPTGGTATVSFSTGSGTNLSHSETLWIRGGELVQATAVGWFSFDIATSVQGPDGQAGEHGSMLPGHNYWFFAARPGNYAINFYQDVVAFGENYTIQLDSHVPTDIGTVTTAVALTHTGGALTSGSSAFYLVTADSASQLHVTVTPDAAGDVSVTVLGGNQAFNRQAAGAVGAPVSLDGGEPLDAGETFVVAVAAGANAVTSHTVTITATP